MLSNEKTDKNILQPLKDLKSGTARKSFKMVFIINM